MNILVIGDVVSNIGMFALNKTLCFIKNKYSIDLTIVNGENASGCGITKENILSIFNYGVDVLTLGNHAFKKRTDHLLDDNKFILRPLNFHACNSYGNGYCTFNFKNKKILIVVLQGQYNMPYGTNNPFVAITNLLKKEKFDIGICEIHAEATSEKKALGFFLDGKFSIIFGTHTHVQTSDYRILPNGSGYITDIGMTGSYTSVLGISPEKSISIFTNSSNDLLQNTFDIKYNKDFIISGVVFKINDNNFSCEEILPINIIKKINIDI